MTDLPPRNPNAGIIGCTVAIDGATVSDGAPGTSPLDPTVLSGLTVVWGRSSTVEQPSPATCSFTLLDLPGDQTFMDQIKVGSRVDVSASATVWPDDPTESTHTDPTFDGYPAGSAVPVDVTNGSAVAADERPGIDPAGWHGVSITPTVGNYGQGIDWTDRPVYFYGNSYTVGQGASTPARRWSSLVAASVRADEVNRGDSGATAKEIVGVMVGQHPNGNYTWTPGTDTPLVCIYPGLNTIRRHGNAYIDAYRHQVRALIACARSSRKIEHTAYNYPAGSWTPVTRPLASGGEVYAAGATGASYQVSFTGPEVTVIGLVGGPRDPVVEYSIDGTPVRTVSYGGFAYTEETDGDNNGSTGDAMAPTCERFTGLGPGTHTLTVTKTGGQGNIYADCAFECEGNPPPVLLILDNPLNDWNNTPPRNNGSDAALTAHNSAARAVAGEFPRSGVRVAGQAAQWNKTRHLTDDRVHPNDAGYRVIADNVSQVINDWLNEGSTPPSNAVAVLIPPAPFVAEGTAPDAWDAIPTTTVGQQWSAGLDLIQTLGVKATITPVLFSGPWPSAARLEQWTIAPGTADPAPFTPVSLDGEFTPSASGRWVGLRLVLDPAGMTWDGLIPGWENITWDTVPEGHTWDMWAETRLTNVRLMAPADGTARTVAVYSGRVTDLAARYDRRVGGSVIDVQCQDFTADLANVYVGGTPWPTEPAADRMRRILAAAAPDVDLLADPRPAALPVAARDVDRQPAGQLLVRIAQSVDAVLRAAVHPSTGPYLRLEDPAGRAALARLIAGPGGIIVIEPADPATLRRMPPDVINLDPVRWTQSVSDVVSRVTVDWQDASTTPATQRTVTRSNLDLVALVGERSASLSSELASETDARIIADQLLARLDDTGWRISGLLVDTGTLDLGPAVIDLMLTLLDGTARIGLPLSIPGIPEWTPSPVTSPGIYVEGGTLAYVDGCWSCDLTATTPNGLGESVRWDEPPAAWTWDQFGEITWDDLTGVGI